MTYSPLFDGRFPYFCPSHICPYHCDAVKCDSGKNGRANVIRENVIRANVIRTKVGEPLCLSLTLKSLEIGPRTPRIYQSLIIVNFEAVNK
jgi:hypothetical protein